MQCTLESFIIMMLFIKRWEPHLQWVGVSILIIQLVFHLGPFLITCTKSLFVRVLLFHSKATHSRCQPCMLFPFLKTTVKKTCISWSNMSRNLLRRQGWWYVVFPRVVTLTLHDIDFNGTGASPSRRDRASHSTIKCKSWGWLETNWKAKIRPCCKLPFSDTNNQQHIYWDSTICSNTETSRAIQYYMKRIRTSWLRFLLYLSLHQCCYRWIWSSTETNYGWFFRSVFMRSF